MTVLKRLGTSFDAGLLFTLLMSLFAVLPQLAHPGLFAGHDTLNHAFRVGEVARQWSQGILLPRWAETFYFGYGSPVFQYYAPLTYTLSAGFVQLFGLDAVGALRLLVILCLPAAGMGMYLFVREHINPRAGILAALVYVYSPYIVFTEPITRGDYPELLCFALFPLVMWRVERLLHTRRGKDFALVSLAIGIFALAHNLMSVLLLALLVGWIIWRKLFGMISWAQFFYVAASTLLGIGLALYFWLPIVLEHNAVQLGNVPVNIQSEQENFFGFFVPLNRLLALSPLADAGAANGTLLRLNLGVAQWVLAFTGILGLAFLVRQRIFTTEAQRPQRKFQEKTDLSDNLSLGTRNSELGTNLSTQHSVLSTIFFAFAALILIGMMLPLASGLWTSVAALNFLEFPWRLLGPIAFCLAVLAGMNAVWIERLPIRTAQIATIALIVTPVLLALPTLYVPVERLTRLDTSPAAYLQSELSGQTSPGTSARNDFLPQGVKILPGATQSLLDDFADGAPVNKINPLSIPPDSSATLVKGETQESIWQVQAAAPFTMELMTFYFAGWTAEIDGQPAPIIVSKPHGFMRIDVPAGDHSVRVFLAETPARQLGTILSLIALAATIILAWRIKEKRIFTTVPRGGFAQAQRTQRENRENQENIGLSARQPSSLNPQSSIRSSFPSTLHLALSTIFTFAAVALLMREGVAWVESPPGEVRIAQHQTVYNLGDQIQLLGYDVSAENVKVGEWLEVVLYWSVREKPDYNYSSFVHFSDGDRPLAQADRPLPSGMLTSEWLPGAYYRDEYSLHIPGDVSSGEYHINIGLYTCDTLPAGECGNGDRLPATDMNGNDLGDILQLGAVTVSP